MANFTNYQEGKAAMLMLETQQQQQQRDVGTKSTATTTANGDGLVGEPPSSSPLINIGGGAGGGGGGSRFYQHLPPSNHLHHHHHHHLLLSHHHPPKDQQQQQQQHHHYQHLSGENIAESPGRKASSSSTASSSSSSLGQVHTAEDPAAAAVAAASSSSGSSHVYTSVSVPNTSDVVDDIRKCGYLRKQKHGHKRFFVLRAASHLGPSRLEYYDSEKKFRNSLRSAATAAASGGAVAPSPPKRVIYLYQCFTVNKRADSKNKHLIALYTKDEYFAIVAENEQEQEDWYVAVSELMSEGKKGHLDSDDLDDGYGTVTPGTVFKEVWQVNVKPKGLGQTKNLTGVYRLCLSTKTIHLVKLNSETPCVNLQLMNIRRCGHSESFFFIEVGRSSSIGPGEIWMQVDDSVVAQNMHETILETMKALKAFAEFRPRSKSQSSGSNPMPFITTRRHLGNLPPSQTGLQRRSRTESVVGTPPSSKSSGASGYRFRTSSEGEGTMNRPFRSATGSLVHLNSARAHHGRQEGGSGGVGVSGVATGNAGTSTGGGGRYVRAIPGASASTYHARSASLPVSHFPSTTSPVSVSSSSGHGSVSDTLTRPSSASICGSPSDGGFNSSDEYGSSPGDFRYFRVRSNTPDSLGNTPPIREENCLNDYMAMGWNREVFGAGAGSGNNSGGDTPRDESTSTTEDDRFSSSSLRRRTHSFSRPAGGATGGSGVAVYQKMTQTNFSLEEGSDVVLPFGSGLLRGGPSSSSSSLRSDYSSCSEHSQQSRPSTLPRTDAGSERPPLSSSAKEDSGYMPMMCGVAASPRDTPPDYMPMQPSSYSHHVSQSPQFHHSPALSHRSAHHPPQLQSQSSADSHGYMMMLPGGGGSSPSPVQASPSPHSSSSMAGASGSDSIAERPENGEYMDMSYSNSGGRKLLNEGSSGYYTPGTPEGTSKSYSPYFSLPRSYKAPTREKDEKEYGEYVPMSSPAKPVYSSVATGSITTPEKRAGGGGSSTSTPSHPPPPYGAHHTTAALADRRVVRPNRLPLGRRSFHGPLRVSEPSSVSAGSSTSVPATGSAPEGPSSPGEYINIEFGDHYPHQQQPPAYPLSAQDEAPSLGSGDSCHSPPHQPQTHQDYMSVEVGVDQQDSAGCLGKNQSPRPSLVAPWNPPSYIRPLATNPGALASPGVPAGGHWRSMGDDYTDMTFNLSSRGERTQTSPTAMLQHLCVIEGRYGHAPSASSSSISPTLPPSSPSRAPAQQPEPKVVRADPQGRRRHSSETFSSTSSSNSTPSGGAGGGLAPSSSATHPAPAPNGSYLTEGQASRWASSASFDSVWMSVEGLGGDSPAHQAQTRALEAGATSGASAASTASSSSGAGRMCRNMSVGYQNGLNYIALELREDGSNAGGATTTSGGGSSSNGSSSAAAAAGTGTVPLPENGAYASIDFTKSDGVTTTTKD
ncbi:insulin receptor substrate 2-A isoform X2 [Scomber scombrus]|uniref:insulin receptor substrate 2-A isoform X2 n=1 Tax=Scomber scombrus TaxID=13677 RepID=UPI002DDB66F2|nr:insulin receptor substrate 2-A isoform X2 [Scomber scombrus]